MVFEASSTETILIYLSLALVLFLSAILTVKSLMLKVPVKAGLTWRVTSCFKTGDTFAGVTVVIEAGDVVTAIVNELSVWPLMVKVTVSEADGAKNLVVRQVIWDADEALTRQDDESEKRTVIMLPSVFDVGKFEPPIIRWEPPLGFIAVLGVIALATIWTIKGVAVIASSGINPFLSMIYGVHVPATTEANVQTIEDGLTESMLHWTLLK